MSDKSAKKLRKKCKKIIGKDVRAAFNKGNLPVDVVLAWVGEKDAYFVNLKRMTCREYVKQGKFIMKRTYTVRIKSKAEFCPHCTGTGEFHNQFCMKLLPVPKGLCPGCLNQTVNGVIVRGLTHNQFCDSLKGNIYESESIFD